MMRPLTLTSKILAGVSLFGLIMVAANYAPLLSTYAEQDACSFGPVSNTQYRSYLSEAKDRQRTKWPAFNGDGKDIERQLNFRLSDMLSNEKKSVYERIAIMHAILRSIGAKYLNIESLRVTRSYENPLPRGQSITSNYQVDINRLVSFQLYPRTIWIVSTIADPTVTRPDVLRRYGLQYFVAHVLYLVDPPPEHALAKSRQSCPQVPSEETATNFSMK